MNNEKLVHLYQQGDKKVLEKLIERNKGIVYKLANKFWVEGNNSIDKEDLIQEGYIGLITAANRYKFDVEKPVKFITYAVYWVYSKINRYITQRSTNREISLNANVQNEENKVEIINTIKDENDYYENLEEILYNKQLRQELDEAMSKYNSLQEREILKLRYGWNPSQCATLKELGEMFNLTSGSIRQREQRALNKLRISKFGAKWGKEIYKEKKAKALSSIDYNLRFIDWKNKYMT